MKYSLRPDPYQPLKIIELAQRIADEFGVGLHVDGHKVIIRSLR